MNEAFNPHYYAKPVEHRLVGGPHDGRRAMINPFTMYSLFPQPDGTTAYYGVPSPDPGAYYGLEQAPGQPLPVATYQFSRGPDGKVAAQHATPPPP